MIPNFSWTIAIKSLRIENESDNAGQSTSSSRTSGYTGEIYDEKGDFSLLMEEAKTMMKVGEYHENIVNLQGMTAKVENEIISQVMGLLFSMVFTLYQYNYNHTVYYYTGTQTSLILILIFLGVTNTGILRKRKSTRLLT